MAFRVLYTEAKPLEWAGGFEGKVAWSPQQIVFKWSGFYWVFESRTLSIITNSESQLLFLRRKIGDSVTV